MRSSHARAYGGWSTLAEYFDGDGTVEFSVKRFRIEIRLAFDDNWKPLLDSIRGFLLKRSISAGRVRRKQESHTWHVVISSRKSVLRMAKAMLPYVIKKRVELVAVIEYLEGRSTGQEFVNIMNRQVRIGERTGKVRRGGPKFTHPAGVKASRVLAESLRRGSRLTPVDLKTANAILQDRRNGSLFKELTAKYGYSRWILRRIIRDGKTRPAP